VHPSGPSAALDVLRRLSEPRFAAAADRIVRGFASRFAARPERWPALAAAAAKVAPATQQAVAALAPKDAGAPDRDWPTSANRVRAVAAASTAGAEDQLRVELAIEPGWHMNANPASYPYLIPTAISIEGIAPTRVRYPPPRRFAPRFVAEPINVYEGRVVIEADFPKGALTRRGGVVARLTVQACNDTVCLPPETIAVPVRADDRPALKRATSPVQGARRQETATR
jgi:hypothetical protein